MKKKKNIAIPIAIMLGVSLQTLLWSATVLATSAFDDVVQNTPTVTLKRGSNIQSITSNYLNLVSDCSRWTSTSSSYGISCLNFNTKLNGALNNSNGWFVVERTAKIAFSIGDQDLAVGDKYVALGVNDAINNNGQFAVAEGTDGLFLKGSNTTCSAYVALNNQSEPVVATTPCTSGNSEASQISVKDNYWLWTSRLLFANTAVDYPTGYEGQQAYISEVWADLDGDGLIASEEASQDTSNSSKDTDGDGLNDYIESQWYPGRQSVFCGTSCAYPSPTQKDIFVEVDWMNDGTRSYQPSAAQLASVTSAYANKEVLAHFDTGQYGGGNELPVYVGQLYFESDPNNLDFYDLKNGGGGYAANFNTNRLRIWHYLITGYQVKFKDPNNQSTYITDSSGVSFPGDDDLAVAVGHIQDNQSSFGYSSVDTALSGTILHEIGHTVCLSNGAYSGQSAGCQFDKIDTYAGNLYDSVMNYTKQMLEVDYSNGVNGTTDDHDDWAAVLGGGMADFTNTSRDAGDSAAGAKDNAKVKKQKEKVAYSIRASTARELRKAGKLGR